MEDASRDAAAWEHFISTREGILASGAPLDEADAGAEEDALKPGTTPIDIYRDEPGPEKPSRKGRTKEHAQPADL